MKKHNYYVYIISNKQNGILYTGVTSDLKRRIRQHKDKLIEGFSKKYNSNKLVYFVYFENIETAISYEKKLKKWKRKWKLELIEKHNPLWIDLYLEL
jgi:putative endonuclease